MTIFSKCTIFNKRSQGIQSSGKDCPSNEQNKFPEPDPKEIHPLCLLRQQFLKQQP